MSRAILIPVKDLTRAKQRLAPLLTQAARTELARAMLEDVFNAVAAARGADSVYVVTSCPEAAERARALGWETLRETEQVSESDSVDRAAKELAARGVELLLRLPIDIPLVQPADIEELLQAAGPAPMMVAVPSRDGRGTNALLRTPPALFPSHFGEGSFAKHLAEAQARRAQIRVLRNPRIELDVDDPADLRALLAALPNGETATGRCLQRLGAHL
jgi:2-phospho-L-lactate guanylyltransferase